MNGGSSNLHFLRKAGFTAFLLFATTVSTRRLQQKIKSQNIDDNKRLLQTSVGSKEYSVTWDIDLGGKDALLESDFLKAGLEYSVKDYINKKLQCEARENEDLEGASFFKVRIENIEDENKVKRLSGNGKCKGNRTRCKKKIKKSISDAGKHPENATGLSYGYKKFSTSDSCETSIFEMFKDTLITASFFNYNVTLDVINDFAGDLKVDLNVAFQESSGDGLDQIESVSFDAEEPVEINVDCDTSCQEQRQKQRSIITNIYNSWKIPFDDNEHECLFEGINCNEQDLVTHAWLSK